MIQDIDKIVNKKCPACESIVSNTFAELDQVKLGSFKKYDEKYYENFLSEMIRNIEVKLLECSHCKHIYWYEIPNKELISQMYIEHAKITNLKSKNTKKQTYTKSLMNKTIVELKKLNPESKTFLDYGAGGCLWSSVASSYFDVTAFDPYLERMEKNKKYTIENNMKNLTGKTFDFIFCNQVFEHVDNPADSIKEIKKVCHSNSILYITVPNVGRENRKKLKDEWPYNGSESHLMAPFQHLQGFNQNSLKILLNKSGFKELSRFEMFKWSKIYFFRFLLGKYIPSVSTTCFIGRIND